MCVTARARIKKCGEVSLRKRKVSDQKSREQILKRMLMAWPRLDGRSEHTYAELAVDSAAFAAWLGARGVGSGDVVSIQLPNRCCITFLLLRCRMYRGTCSLIDSSSHGRYGIDACRNMIRIALAQSSGRSGKF